MLQAVLVSQLHDNRLDLLIGPGKNLGSHILHRGVQVIGNGLHGFPGRIYAAVGKVLGRHQSQHIGRAAVGDGDALAAL